MSTIPLDLERRFEQRWATRFSRPLSRPRPKASVRKARMNPSTLSSKLREKPAELNQRTEACPSR